MASTIKIKRSNTAGGPSTLQVGELAYSSLEGFQDNGGDRLYIGVGSAGGFDTIGGKYFTELLKNPTGTLYPDSALLVDSNSKINQINVGGITLTGSNNTISTTVTNANLVLSPHGVGRVSIAGAFTLPRTDGTAGQFLKTDGTGTVNWATVTASGSATVYIGTTLAQTDPIKQGLTGITNIEFPGATSGIVTLAATANAGTNTITLPAASGTLITSGDSATVTNTMLAGSIINSKLVNSYVTLGSTSVSLGTTATTLAGLSSVTSTAFVGGLTGNASTASTLATARNINNVSFNGSTDITVAADANTLTGTILKSTVTDSSLTSVGIITSGTWSGNAISVARGGTGSTDGSIAATGILTLAAGGTDNSVLLVPKGIGTVDVAFKRITSLADPTAATDAASKNYVDSVASGINAHQSVRAATTTTLATLTGGTVTYANGAAGVGSTLTLSSPLTVLDASYVLVAGDRILVKNEVAAANNGIYIYTSSSTLTRAGDFDSTSEVGGGDFVFVTAGTTLASTGWVQSTKSIIIGTTPIVFTQFSGAGTYLNGTGLSLMGTTFSLASTTVATGSYGLAASVPQFTVNAQGQITAAANVAIAIGAGQITSGVISIAQGGTNSTATPIAGAIGYGTGTAHAYNTAGTTGQVLVSAGAAAPTWASLGSITVASISGGTTGLTPNTATSGAVTLGGTLAVANGGTNLTSYALGDLVYASAANTLTQLTKPATSTSLLTMTSTGTPSWVPLTTTGITGVGTITVGTWNGTAITVGYGGTGATTLAAKGIVIGNGASMVTTAVSSNGTQAASTSYGLLTSDVSNNPVWTDTLDGGTYL